MSRFQSYQALKKRSHDSQVSQEATVVGIGNFDGVHLGHQVLLQRVINLASEFQITPSVLTFSPHPLRFFRGDQGPRQLYSEDDRSQLLESLGLELILTQQFDQAFASLSPADFVKEVLVEGLKAQYVVVGYDFAFGAKRMGTIDDLIRLTAPFHIKVEVIAAQHPSVHIAERPYSSTWIRELVSRGEMALARQALGRAYHLRAQVVKGLQRGRKLGFPTANLMLRSELSPQPGVYSAWLNWGQGPQKSIVSIGSNPTFTEVSPASQQQKWSIEVHVLDQQHLDLYDLEVQLWFIKFIRAQERFPSQDALKAQIMRDCEEAKVNLLQETEPLWPKA